MLRFKKRFETVKWVLSGESRAILVPDEEKRQAYFRDFPMLKPEHVILPPKPEKTKWVEGVNYFVDESVQYENRK